DAAAVGRLPPALVARLAGVDAAPEHGAGDTDAAQDLRQLAGVAELIGDVADHQRTPVAARHLQAQQQIAHNGLAADQEQVGVAVPRAHGQTAPGNVPAQLVGPL